MKASTINAFFIALAAGAFAVVVSSMSNCQGEADKAAAEAFSSCVGARPRLLGEDEPRAPWTPGACAQAVRDLHLGE
jgi:hypothetical protein